MPRTLYFRAGGAMAFEPPGESGDAFDEYVSDPAKPVPFTMEVTTDYPRSYPVHDQRFAAALPSVMNGDSSCLELVQHRQSVTSVGPMV